MFLGKVSVFWIPQTSGTCCPMLWDVGG